MNTENSKTNESHRFRLDLTDKLNLKNPKVLILFQIIKIILNLIIKKHETLTGNLSI